MKVLRKRETKRDAKPCHDLVSQIRKMPTFSHHPTTMIIKVQLQISSKLTGLKYYCSSRDLSLEAGLVPFIKSMLCLNLPFFFFFFFTVVLSVVFRKLVWHCKDFFYRLFWSFILSPSLLKKFIAQSDNLYNLRHVRDFGNAQSHEISCALQKANRLDCMQKTIIENQSLSRCQKKSYASEWINCSTLPFPSSSAISNRLYFYSPLSYYFRMGNVNERECMPADGPPSPCPTHDDGEGPSSPVLVVRLPWLYIHLFDRRGLHSFTTLDHRRNPRQTLQRCKTSLMWDNPSTECNSIQKHHSSRLFTGDESHSLETFELPKV